MFDAFRNSLIYTAEKLTCHLGVKPHVKCFNVSVCVRVSGFLTFSTLLWLMSSWYGMCAGRYVCRSAQKARPSLQLLLKLVTSIFWKRNRWITNNSLAIMKSSECSHPRRADEPPGNMVGPWRKRKKKKKPLNQEITWKLNFNAIMCCCRPFGPPINVWSCFLQRIFFWDLI